MSKNHNKYIYIVVSKTNTTLGKLIQKKLGVNYNHCSISLDSTLETIYSFGRKELRNIFKAGFVMESKNKGYFKVHSQSNIVVMQVSVTEAEWFNVAHTIAKFKSHKEIYKYSLLGLVYCYFGIAVKRRHKYFCSQFVAEILKLSGITLFEKSESLVRPHDFLELPLGRLIYSGNIGDYCIF